MEQYSLQPEQRDFEVSREVYSKAQNNLEVFLKYLKNWPQFEEAMIITYKYTYMKLSAFGLKQPEMFEIKADITKYKHYELIPIYLDNLICDEKNELSIATLLMSFNYACDYLYEYLRKKNSTPLNNSSIGGVNKVNEVKNEKPAGISPFALLIIEILGNTGFFEAGTIYPEFVRLYDSRKLSNLDVYSKYKYALRILKKHDLITVDNKVKHPCKGRYAVYILTEKGKERYKAEFNKAPVESESAALERDHDNLTHALGIRALHDFLVESKEYNYVSMNSVANEIKLGKNSSYIPDIVAKGRVPGKPYSFTAYFEYERGTHHQGDFNDKLNKAISINKRVHIVCPGATEVEILKDKVDRYISSRGTDSLKNLRSIRITTLDYIQKAVKQKVSINKDSVWTIVYDSKKGFKPVHHENKSPYKKK